MINFWGVYMQQVTDDREVVEDKKNNSISFSLDATHRLFFYIDKWLCIQVIEHDRVPRALLTCGPALEHNTSQANRILKALDMPDMTPKQCKRLKKFIDKTLGKFDAT